MAAIAFGVLIIAVSACGGPDGDSLPASTTAATTTAPPRTTAPTEKPTTTEARPEPAPSSTIVLDQVPSAFVDGGSFSVGVDTRELPTGNLVEIWYPAAGANPEAVETYHLRTFLPEALVPIIPEELDDTFGYNAERGAAPSAAGPFPLILFSHGFASFRLQSTELLRHLASWGFVVAAPDHPSRDLAAQLGAAAPNPPGAVDDLRSTRTLMEIEAVEGSLAGVIDATQVVLAGHSAGGSTVLEMASDAGVLAYISLAAGAGAADLPDMPSLFMAGETDGIIAASQTAEAFGRAPSPSWLWKIPDAGHLVFTDLCAIGAGNGGLVGLAEGAGIVGLVPENLQRLATDGCLDPNRPVSEVWPVVRHATTVFALSVTGDPDVSRALDTNPVESVSVEISADTGP